MKRNLLWSFILGCLIALASGQDCIVTVQDLVLTQADGVVVASWGTAESTDGCDVQYAVVVSNNVDTVDDVTFTTAETSIDITGATVPCAETTVSVSGNGGASASVTATLETSATTAPILRDMITSCNSIQMIWEAQPYEENICQVTHFQMFCLSDTHNFTIPQAVTDVRHRTFDILITVLQPDIYYTCNGFIFVTLAGFSPASENIEFWSNLDSVRDLEVEETETSLRATWEAPLNSEECGVAYDVTYENEILGSTTVEVVGLSHDFDIELIPCTDYTITVSPISFTGSKGTAVSTEITPSVRVGQVSNLLANDDGNIILLSWDAAQVGQCGVSYVVEHVSGDTVETFITSDTSLTFNRVPCSTSYFSVAVASEDILGDDVVIALSLDSSDIRSIDAVRNVAFDGSLLTWDPPLSVGLCDDIVYQVSVVNDFTESSIALEDTRFALDLIPCSLNTITVYGTLNDIVGDESVLDVVANSAVQSAPSHVSTIPGFTEASITLQGESISDNFCTVEAVVMECSNDNADSFERSISVDDISSRLFTVLVDDLEEDTIYTCVARLDNSLTGNEFAFRTIPLAIKELTISEVGQNSFLVSWSEEYGQQFVNGYTLTVESLGPLHDVPDRCDVERGATFQFELSNDELSSLFVQGLPNYDYRASLVTSYTLGVERTSTEAADQTLTGEPGLPQIQNVNWIYSDGDLYDVSVDFSWLAPCDLNGSLQGFGVNVTAHFAIAGIAQSISIDAGFGETDVNSELMYSLVGVNPFSTYEVAINVEAAESGASSVHYLEPPSACVCAAP